VLRLAELIEMVRLPVDPPGVNQNVPTSLPAGIVILVTLAPPDVAWNVSEPLELAGVITTPEVPAG